MRHILALIVLVPASLFAVLPAVAQTTTTSSASSGGSGTPDVYDISCGAKAPISCYGGGGSNCRCSNIGVYGCSDMSTQTLCKNTYNCGCVKEVSIDMPLPLPLHLNPFCVCFQVTSSSSATAPASTSTAKLNTLAKAFGNLYFGTATDNPELTDTAYMAILNDNTMFGRITPVNGMSWVRRTPSYVAIDCSSI